MSQFTDLSLATPILNALKENGYTTPTPIQAQAIPHLLKRRDLLGIAQTGTGKTAAFSLPLLDHLTRHKKHPRERCVRALILTPTRELASQIDANIAKYATHLRISHSVVFGGVGQRPQIHALRRGQDIVTATPGRLLDLMNQGHIRLDQLETFILDEADRMLDMGFIHDIRKVVAKLPPKRHTLLFSATMPKDIDVLAQTLLHNPERVEITPQSTTVERIDQRVMHVRKNDKRNLLLHVLDKEPTEGVLVFSRTKHGADRVAEFLSRNSVSAAALHGNKSQGQRERALAQFRNKRLRVLVATDIAARGIDVVGISHVINFDLPNDPEAYVHRIGRTARAGRDGVAISFCDAEEGGALRSIERAIRRRVPVDAEHEFHMEPVAGQGKSEPRTGRQARSGNKAKRNQARKPHSGGAGEQGRAQSAHHAQGGAQSAKSHAGNGQSAKAQQPGAKSAHNKPRSANAQNTGKPQQSAQAGQESRGGKPRKEGHHPANKGAQRPARRSGARRGAAMASAV
ncbi:DEAD/DEAH box helicase [Magnetofaba australis]|uniref:DEAD-box ATP-dependent RNA helicase RhpA n=1 Tax=Magnetofaba australis IT-1 TaxID=1434232 RepID=A0A1Y2K5C8_9PROT|nr:DEAD/DEAH box helicase [Magnetofaba australis]OSM04894.1 putative DEAD/DEAH box helicase [Magnetofaba australis IT-1]